MAMVLFMSANDAVDILKAYQKVRNSIPGSHSVGAKAENDSTNWMVSIDIPSHDHLTFLEVCANIYAELPNPHITVIPVDPAEVEHVEKAVPVSFTDVVETATEEETEEFNPGDDWDEGYPEGAEEDPELTFSGEKAGRKVLLKRPVSSEKVAVGVTVEED
jgi:hypothetical protein